MFLSIPFFYTTVFALAERIFWPEAARFPLQGRPVALPATPWVLPKPQPIRGLKASQPLSPGRNPSIDGYGGRDTLSRLPCGSVWGFFCGFQLPPRRPGGSTHDRNPALVHLP